MRSFKKGLAAVFFAILLASFTGCSSNKSIYSPAYTSAPTLRATRIPTSAPTARPTDTPAPMPNTMKVIYEYLKVHEGKEEYTLSSAPTINYQMNHELELVYDEVPEYNGRARVEVESDSKNVYISFSESDFLGQKLCAPQLIKAVTQGVVSALCEDANVDNVAEKVLLSYDEDKYTYITYAGDYAFVFAPSSVYKTEFYAVYMPEYQSKCNPEEYSPMTYEQFSAQINESSKCSINATVKSIMFGSYRNSFTTYPCMMMEVEDSDGNSYTVAHHMKNVPMTFVEGETYIFYGTTMFDINNRPMLYLHYAK